MTFPQPFYKWRPHPWHGLEVGPKPPQIVHAFIEITPFDLVKYEVDKATGYLKVDRPQRTSSVPPTLYGFIPRTYCGTRVQKLHPGSVKGDGDPLDIVVVSERPISRPEVFLCARVIGGLRVTDHGEADDKIVAVLENDRFWREAHDITDLPEVLVERMSHYYSTYKMIPGEENQITLQPPYGREEAQEVVKAAMADYESEYGS